MKMILISVLIYIFSAMALCIGLLLRGPNSQVGCRGMGDSENCKLNKPSHGTCSGVCRRNQ